MKINGLKKIKKKIIKNSKGDILKFLVKKDPYFRGFGEIYFTEIKKNKIKGWNCHKKFYCILTVPFGKVKFTFIDGRSKMKSYLKKQIIHVDKNRYNIILVLAWNFYNSIKTKCKNLNKKFLLIKPFPKPKIE